MGINLKDGIQGNVDSATKLENARKINGVEFDGTKDITITTKTSWNEITNIPSAFPPAGHNHDVDYLRKTEKSVDSDKLDGYDSSYFAPNAHNHDSIYSKLGHTHDDRYYTESECNANFLGKNAKASDSDKLDGIDSTGFARAYSSSYSFGGNQNKINTTQFITMLEGLGAFTIPYWVARGSWSYAGNQIINDTGCGDIHLAGCTVEVVGTKSAFTIMIHTPTTSSGGVVNGDFIYVNNGDSYSPKWRRLYNTESQPNFKDLAGLPTTFTPSSHTHDDRYYTESESDNRFLGKSAKATDSDKLDGHDSSYFSTVTHIHDDRYIPMIPTSENEINASKDFNNYTNVGIYGVSADTNPANSPYINRPYANNYGQLICVKRGQSDNGVNQIFLGQNGDVFNRVKLSSNGSWTNWTCQYSSNKGNVTDFNKVWEEGIWVVGSGTSIPNAPYDGNIYGTLEVLHKSTELIQRFSDNLGNVHCRFRNYQGAWQSWVKQISTKTYDDAFIFKNELITSNFNNYTNQGKYWVYNERGITNAPKSGGIYGMLEVLRTNADELIQRFTAPDFRMYGRFKNSANNWTSWKIISSNEQNNYTINSTSGYQSFPSGICIQWGQFTTNGGVANISFPVSFANNAYSITGNPIDPNAHYVSFKGEWAGGAVAVCDWCGSPVGGRWIAVGTL